MPDNPPNFENRTLFHGDNLPFLRAMNTGSVHLIATDPPFNKGKDFHATPDSLAAGAKFQDRWSWADDVEGEWVDQITDDWPHVMNVINGSKESYGEDMGAFLCFMGVRLLEMRRVLRDDGSIYLHCDPTASHYLKELMDAVFGRHNFRNEIVWCYPPKGNGPKFGFHRKHDIILLYGKSANKGTFSRPHTDLDDRQQGKFSFTDEEGRQYKEFKGRRTYLDQSRGRPVPDWWTDIAVVGQSRTQFLGYPTQKPIALYERIIEASSNPGDIVLDPFCGCATTPVAAERLGRQWVGIDLWTGTHQIILDRLQAEGLAGPGGATDRLITFGDITYTAEQPERTDDGGEAVPYLQVRERYAEPEGPRMTRAQMYEHLLAQYGQRCQGCDRTFDDRRYLELDHNTPRSDGGLNHITNRVLLCSPCNRLKAHRFTLSGLREQNRKLGYMAK